MCFARYRSKVTMPMDDQITIVGSSYFQPIADLIEKLAGHPMPLPGRQVQAAEKTATPTPLLFSL